MRKRSDQAPTAERRYDPPKAPKINLSLAEAYKIEPYALYVASMPKDTTDEDDLLRYIVSDDSNIVVGIGQLTAKQMLQYEQANGRSIQDTWTILAYYEAYLAGAGNALPEGIYLEQSDDGKKTVFHTHMGSMTGSYAKNVVSFVASIMSLVGRITGLDSSNMASGGYKLEPITAERVLDVLNFDALTSPTQDAEGNLIRSEYERILMIIGLIRKPNAPAAAQTETTEDSALDPKD